MNTNGTENGTKLRKDWAKQAISLASRSMWEEAVLVNRLILKTSRRDFVANNRLGKALSELGRYQDAREAFQRALELSPYNNIAKKNLDRLERLDDEAHTVADRGSAIPDAFIDESGRTGVTSLVNLAPADVLLKLVPGRAVKLQIESGKLIVIESSGVYVGQVEPKLASRLIRLDIMHLTRGHIYATIEL
jgi:tetratricopeptide (TPR) repeat protein